MDELLGLLRSKDIDRYEQVKTRLFSTNVRYTTAQASDQSSVAYVTYPRSGNSLMRKYFENITGIATGSDMVMKHTPNVALQVCGFKGEGIVDDRTWIKKSHYPWVFAFQKYFDAEMAVICTRNPLDITPSFFYLVFCFNHVGQFKEKLLEDPVWLFWKRFQRQCTIAWKIWHDYWIKVAEDSSKPVYFFRFEDVLENPREELTKLFKFILAMDSLEGTVIERRIEDVLKMDKKSTQAYTPRSGGINKNMKNYTPE